jgi:putative transposase
MKTHYKRYLPHIIPPDERLFITFRLANSLPKDIILKLMAEKNKADEQIRKTILDETARKLELYKIQKRYFAKFDTYLHQCLNNVQWLGVEAVAEVLAEALHYRDVKYYQLHAFCIMPNHVHILLTSIIHQEGFFRVLQSLKRHTARKSNELLDMTGNAFWGEESYDHVVRDDEEFVRIIDYIVQNPVKAGLVSKWEEWRFTYLSKDIVQWYI